LTTSITS